PQIGSIKQDGSTSEELKMLTETRKILSLPDVQVITTCVRVPTAVGHGAAVHARFAQPIDFAEVEGILRHAPGVRMSDLPNVHEAAGNDACFVGRVRPDPFDPNAISFFTVSDNLRKGAALNAVQIAEILLPG
ncbi:MAG: Asd/ArgC dimerization domain-containing protein, partial [Actinomycetota bacterium]